MQLLGITFNSQLREVQLIFGQQLVGKMMKGELKSVNVNVIFMWQWTLTCNKHWFYEVYGMTSHVITGIPLQFVSWMFINFMDVMHMQSCFIKFMEWNFIKSFKSLWFFPYPLYGLLVGWAGQVPGPVPVSTPSAAPLLVLPHLSKQSQLTRVPHPAPSSPAHLSYTNKQVPASSCPRVWTVTSSGG